MQNLHFALLTERFSPNSAQEGDETDEGVRALAVCPVAATALRARALAIKSQAKLLSVERLVTALVIRRRDHTREALVFAWHFVRR